MKIKKQTLSKLFGFAGKNTITEWSRDENRKALKLLEKYFSQEDIEEFLKNGIVSKLENNQEAFDLQKSIKQDVKNIIKNIQSLNFDHQDKKIFFTFGKFLQNGLNEDDKMKIKTLSFQEYLENQEKMDELFHEKYVQFLESQNLKIIEIHNHINLMDYIYFNSDTEHKFYFLRFMWLLIPSKFEEQEMEGILKFKTLPKMAKKMPGFRQSFEIYNSIGYLFGGKNGK